MTGPDEPGWDFPELTPASVELPEPEPEPIYDTGSDGWWRAQAKAQREASLTEDPPPYVPPAQIPPPQVDWVEPEVLNDPSLLPTGPSPLDDAYLPVEEAWPAVDAEPVTWTEPEIVEPEAPTFGSLEPFDVPIPDAPAAEERPRPLMRPLWVPENDLDHSWYDEKPPTRASADADRVGPGRALAWAGLALAGVGLLVVAFLLLSKAEPKGTPTVSPPLAPAASTAATTDPTASPTPSPTPRPTPSPTPVASPKPVVAPVVPLLVLNNSKISGLADRAATKFRNGGWPVRDTGNYRGRLATSTIYYPVGQRASAERFAKQFGVRVLPRFDTLPGSGMTVVVTRDFNA